MRFIITTAAALAISAGGSFAQVDQNTAEGQTRSQSDGFPSVQPPPPPSLDNQPPQADATGNSSAQRGGETMQLGRQSPVGRGARFMVDTGKTKISVRCGADQSSTGCVEMVIRLLDHVQRSSGDHSDARDSRDPDRYSNRDMRWDSSDRYDERERRWRD